MNSAWTFQRLDSLNSFFGMWTMGCRVNGSIANWIDGTQHNGQQWSRVAALAIFQQSWSWISYDSLSWLQDYHHDHYDYHTVDATQYHHLLFLSSYHLGVLMGEAPRGNSHCFIGIPQWRPPGSQDTAAIQGAVVGFGLCGEMVRTNHEC